MKILVAGDGKVGKTLTQQLSAEGYDLTLIDSDAEVLESTISHYDVITVQGNCASMETLRQAGVNRADLLIAATGSDEVNLLCCMTAHGLNPDLHAIARIRNPDYVEQAYTIQNAFALSLVVNPEKQAAQEIASLLKFPGFLKREIFARSRVEIVELRIDKNSKLSDVPLNTLVTIAKCQVLVCAVLREGEAVAPDGAFILRTGDRIFVTAPTDSLALLLKNLDIITHKARRVMLAGGDRISFYLAENLQKSGIAVQIIEQNEERCRRLSELLPKADIVHGDASDQELLESEGLSNCDALISLTGLDELNIVISLYGSSRGVPQVITKLGRMDNSKILDNLPLGSVICPRKLCCNTIVRYVRAMKNQTGAAVTIHSIADGQAEAIEFLVEDSTLHCGEPLKKLQLRKNILVASITRGDHTEIPNGDSCFQQGDSVVIVASNKQVINQLNDIFQ